MASKRHLEDDADHQHPSPHAGKRSKRDHPSKNRQHQNAYMDPTWGQKYFFAGHNASSTLPQDDDVEFEDDSEALAYLDSVRQQATGIPHLLVAPKIGPQLPPSYLRNSIKEDQSSDEDGEVSEPADHSLYHAGLGDFRGYYHDGAYTAAPDPAAQEDALSDGEPDPSVAIAESYFSSIRDRFLSLRALLHTTPPAHVVAALPTTHSPYVGPFGPGSPTFLQWTKRLETTDPLPAQVASMDKEAVLRVLRIVMGGRFLRVGRGVSERTSRWVWALLARLPDSGELTHDQVAWVRDLGRRAVLLGRSLAEMAALREEIAEGQADLGVNDGVDDSEEDEEVVQDFQGEDVYSESGGSGDMSEAVEDQPSAGRAEEEEEEEEGEVMQMNGAQRPQNESVKEKPIPADQEKEDGEAEEGEVVDDEGVPMELEDEDDAESLDLQAAKERLLAQLEDAPSPVSSHHDESLASERDREERDAMRARMNMRATVNMILTVAGEFYGQRDLLEFRDPFTGM